MIYRSTTSISTHRSKALQEQWITLQNHSTASDLPTYGISYCRLHFSSQKKLKIPVFKSRFKHVEDQNPAAHAEICTELGPAMSSHAR